MRVTRICTDWTRCCLTSNAEREPVFQHDLDVGSFKHDQRNMQTRPPNCGHYEVHKASKPNTRVAQLARLVNFRFVLLLGWFQVGHLAEPLFKWTDCGNENSILHFIDAFVSPVPVPLPGVLDVNGTISLKSIVKRPIKMTLEVDRYLANIPIHVPCIGNYGSCTYKDICNVSPDECPPGFKESGIPCHCPAPSGYFKVPTFPVNMTIKLPPGFAGDYRVKAKVWDEESGDEVGCLQFDVAVKHA